MPKRKRVRLTLPHQSSGRRSIQPADPAGDPNSPSLNDWKDMKAYKSFVVKDVDEVLHTFPVGKYALILPAGCSPENSLDLHEHWVGKIKEIRSRGGDGTEVWTRVQWLWSAKDVSEQKKKFDMKPYGKMERFLSNMYDFVHSSCFQGLARVASFQEFSTGQVPIKEETFYYRSTYDFRTREVHAKPAATCICRVPYNPDDASAMHFCPRSTCNKWYHAPCLRKAGWTEDAQTRKSSRADGTSPLDTAPRYLQLERTRPETSVGDTQSPRGSHTSVMAIDTSTSQTPPLKRKRGRPKKGSQVQVIERSAVTFDRHAFVPFALLALARSPIVRGAETELPRSVVGNISLVLRAREMVANVVDNGGTVPDDWESSLHLIDEDAGAEVWAARDEGLLCPSCGGAV
ncbi:hypothetical protein M0805_000827 [Coniferiporia weirii]|nr:hypothetical protein M0805_000827 [Coniferiporia weirii]